MFPFIYNGKIKIQKLEISLTPTHPKNITICANGNFIPKMLFMRVVLEVPYGNTKSLLR